MARAIVVYLWLYVRLLRLYPRRFRKAFAPEMAAVFAEALHEAGRIGPAAVARFCLRELGELPGSILQEHVREREGRSGMMKLWNYEEQQGITWARRLARGGSLFLLAIIWISTTAPVPPAAHDIVLLLAGAAGIGVAWFREKWGGWLLVGAGALLGAIYLAGVFLGSSTFFISPAVSPMVFYLMVVLVAGLISLPFIAFGALFLLIDRRATAITPQPTA